MLLVAILGVVLAPLAHGWGRGPVCAARRHQRIVVARLSPRLQTIETGKFHDFDRFSSRHSVPKNPGALSLSVQSYPEEEAGKLRAHRAPLAKAVDGELLEILVRTLSGSRADTDACQGATVDSGTINLIAEYCFQEPLVHP